MRFYLFNDCGEILCKEKHYLTHQVNYRFLTPKQIDGINTYRNHEASPLIFHGTGHLYYFLKHHHIKDIDLTDCSLQGAY